MSHAVVLTPTQVLGNLLFTPTTAGALAFIAAGAGAALVKGYIEKEMLGKQLENLQIEQRSQIRELEETDGRMISVELEKLALRNKELLTECCANNIFQLKEKGCLLKMIIHEHQEVRQKIEFLKIDAQECRRHLEVVESAICECFDKIKSFPSSDGLARELERLEQLRQEAGKSSLRQKCASLDEIRETLEMIIRIYETTRETEKINLSEKLMNLESPKASRIRIHRTEISRFFDKIGQLDRATQSSLQSLVKESGAEESLDRLQLVENEIKLKYSRLKGELSWDKVHREELGRLLALLSQNPRAGKITMAIEKVLSTPLISKENADRISKSASDFLMKETGSDIRADEAIGKVGQALAALGYDVMTGSDGEVAGKLKRGEVVYLDTKWREYKVMLKFSGNGEIVTRMVRVVTAAQAKQEISMHQKLKDREIASEWCSEYDQFLAQLASLGLPMDVKIRKEPDEDLQYIVDEKPAGKEKGGRTERKSLKA
ncbi:MAG: hypothetical protein PHW04_07855 [Candidatus Wallbacteria bacterium]|nr:hypothetical protein [Candidatus Wallbacteria bacterium]